ncbi:MAG: hypothetical protein K0Q78_1988 [Cellvibrio sp.]|nr:hypothetical protein [Cellvibrio sp.]
MKMVKYVFLCFTLLIAFVGHLAAAQTGATYAFNIVEGSVVSTPAWCRANPCLPTTAAMTGGFVAQISTVGDHILFPSSSITTTPDVYFQLPTDPDEDSNGVVREIVFTFEGDVVKAKGVVDSRAFDGPLIEYQFIAKVSQSEVFTARPDYRKCLAPLCGGYFVKLVNKKLTQCANGRLQEECYVSAVVFGDEAINAGIHSFANKTPLLLVGAIVPKHYSQIGKLGEFIAKEAYRSATQNTAVGKFYGVSNNGIVCITTPCFSFDQALLNSSNRITRLSDVNLEMSGALPEDVALAQTILANGGTLYATGKNQKYQDFAGIGVRFVAQQFYLPVKPVRKD